MHYCSLAIMFPLGYICDQIINSVCFQRFNRLAINTSDAPSVKLPLSSPISSRLPSFSSSNVREAANNGARLQRVRIARVCMFFYSSEISLQLSVIYTKRATHLTRPRAHARAYTYTHTQGPLCCLCTSGCESVCLHVCAFSSVHCCLIESSIVSNDPSSFLLFYPDQRAKSCCKDENEGLSVIPRQ